MTVLEYKRWDKFYNVIENAKRACENSNNLIEDHFSQVGKMVEIGPKTSRKLIDYFLLNNIKRVNVIFIYRIKYHFLLK